MQTLDFHVPGHPRTKGSWVAIPTKGDVAGVFLKAAAKDEAAWAKAVGWAAKVAMVNQRFVMVRKPHAVALRVVFVMPRPRNPKNDFPVGDLDKLVRSVMDAMTKIVYEDDSQVASLHADKSYLDKHGNHPASRVVGVEIAVEQV